MYVANNDGLLEFNGSKWTLYPTPNESIMRSVNVIGDSIYTGFYMEFGYWEKNSLGLLNYFPLSKNLEIDIVEDEQFWNITSLKKWIFFQSLDRIIILNSETNEISIIESKNTITKILMLGETIFFQIMTEGLYTIKDGRKVLINNDQISKENRFIGIGKINNTPLFITDSKGMYFLNENNILVKWNPSGLGNYNNFTVYSAIQKRNDDIILGTISDGIISLNSKGELNYILDYNNGLSNNTALSLFEDIDENIWVGLDNGIDCINSSAAVKNYIDHKGNLGTTYASAIYNDTIYLGTNQGLFYKPLNTTKPFKLIPSTQGPVWSLNEINGILFCGHNSGTFIIKEDSAELIANVQGTWGVKQIPNYDTILLQGNYDGLYILEKTNESWSLKNKIEGFNISSKYFEITDNSKIFVSHEYKGVYELQIDSSFKNIINTKKVESVKKGIHSGLGSLFNTIYYASEDGIFKTNGENEFIKIPELSEIFENNQYTSGKIIHDSFDRLWFFTKNYLIEVSIDNIDNSYNIVKFSIPNSVRNEMEGYESISFIDKEKFIYGNSNGYLLIDLTEIERNSYNVSINSIYSEGSNSEKQYHPINKVGEFEYQSNSIAFEYSIPEYDKYLTTSFQYKIDNLQEDWSNWSTTDRVEFKSIPAGSYNFEVRAKINDFIIDQSAKYTFVILKPWYLTTLAWIVYWALFICVILGINYLYKRYYRKQRERILEKSMSDLKVKELASQKEIIELKNVQLQKDIEARNRELAISTMSMVSKTTMLNSIKEQLTKINENKALNPVINNINSLINDKKDWEFFEKAFNEADKEFFKKLKQKHPELNNNDLRLCVYLRLNLSSKEIAPLLNISHRSVEIKRYRLRKKLDLERTINLNDYFINL